MARSRYHYPILALIGALAGLTSGLFGVGGGLIIVPGLVWYGLSQREAAATSMAAIIPISIVGVSSYAFQGNVDWAAAGLMALGFITGAPIGSRLLAHLSERFLRWFFVVFVAFIIVSQLISMPTRDSSIQLSIGTAFGIVTCGLATGLLAALLGVGGGAIMVPALSGIFGASDLIARGTSLLAMFPGSVSGTIPNVRAKLINLPTGLIIGIIACLATPFGNMIATHLSATVNTYLFAGYLTFILLRSLWAAYRSPR